MALIRTAPDELFVSEGKDIERLLAVALHPLDPQMMGRAQAHTFAPAKLYVAALGHLLRAYLDPQAWIRQAAFSMSVRRLRLRASPDDLDWIVEQSALQHGAAGEPIEFRFAHVDHEGYPCFDSEQLHTLAGAAAMELIERDSDPDGGLHLLDYHLHSMEEEFSSFFIDSLALSWGEVIELDFEFTPWGLAWDRAAAEYETIKSPHEAPRPDAGWLRRLRGQISPRRGKRRSRPLPPRTTTNEPASDARS